MGEKPTKKPSFFKVLLGDFSSHLRVPQKFTKNHIRPSLGKCVLSGPSGKRSVVELERRKNGLFFHNHGWRSFVKDHLLQFGDFLVFHYDGKSKFKVKIYDRTCCEIDVDVVPMRRNGPPTAPSANYGYQFAGVKDEIVHDLETENYNSDTENADNRRNKESSTRTIIFKSEYSCFKATLGTRSSRYRVGIPKSLVETEGLESKKTVEIEDSTGRLWPAKLVGIAYRHKYMAMSTGWGECSKANKIVVGDTVVFEIVQPTVWRLHVFKNGLRTRGGNNRPISVVLDAPNIKK
ncbi:B3 domain-containing protein REM5-like [Argentina anserina]|uniref:B3 domain-containing protein REM5-like n=1 Tax=Argentina anserina TaxID=57926 RepID=UPI00217684A8|nr:B3 domain-containing protein REM5-like [Potentilla anserina]